MNVRDLVLACFANCNVAGSGNLYIALDSIMLWIGL